MTLSKHTSSSSLQPKASGLFSFFGYDLPLSERLELIARAGIARTSLWWGPPEEMFLQGRIHEIPAMARDLGLVIENLHVPFEECNDLWLSPRRQQEYLRRHLEWIDDAVRHDVPVLVMHASHTEAAPGPTASGLEIFAQVAQRAQQAGVTLAVENTRRDEIFHALMESCLLPSVAFCYDSSHDWLWGKPLWGSLDRWASRLVQTHFSDAQGHDDRHLLPGDGEIDWAALAAHFPRMYQGCIMLEVMPSNLGGMPPEDFLQQCKQKLEWLTGMLRQSM